MNEIKSYIESTQKLLPIGNSVSITESERRAGIFLEAQSRLIDWKHLLSQEKIKLLSIQSVTYAEQMAKCASKTVTETKMLAEASEEYIKSREDLESIDNDITYLKAYLDLFSNSHVFYRQLCKDNS